MKEDDTYQKVNQALEHGASVIVLGCAASMLKFHESDKLKLICLQNIAELDSMLECSIGYDSVKESSCSFQRAHSINTYSQAIMTWDPRLFTPACHDVFSIKISEGCSRKCSYCAIRKATGRLRSIPINDIISQMSDALSSRYSHFRIQCENLSSYGEDIHLNMGMLLDEIGKIKQPFDIDLPDLHPDGLLRYFENIVHFITQKNVYQIHIPVQSGSDSVLVQMNRGYSVKDLIQRLSFLRELSSSTIFGTDIIVGFPGESEADFEKTYNLLEEFSFNPIYIHGYCDKEDTPASMMDCKVDAKTIETRIKLLQERFPYAASYINNYWGERYRIYESNNG